MRQEKEHRNIFRNIGDSKWVEKCHVFSIMHEGEDQVSTDQEK